LKKKKTKKKRKRGRRGGKKEEKRREEEMLCYEHSHPGFLRNLTSFPSHCTTTCTKKHNTCCVPQ
jgi:hypothetical protein